MCINEKPILGLDEVKVSKAANISISPGETQGILGAKTRGIN
jgi:hypothetical protein